MTDKPTGVFVRLPLSGDSVSILRQHIPSKSVTNDELINAIRAIGTPVQGGELEAVGSVAEDKLPGFLDKTYCSLTLYPADTLEVNVVRQSEAQTEIAARDAEIVRLQEHLSKTTGAHLRLLTKRLVAEIDEELARLQEENERLKAALEERNEKIEQDNAALAKLSEQLEDAGAQKVINLLADLVRVTKWEVGDGTEEWDGDVQLTLQNILEEAGIFHKDKGFSTHPEAEANSLPFPLKMTPDIEDALGLISFRMIPYANALRAGGEDIKNRAEDEQAAIIFKVLRKVLAGMDFEVAFQEMHKEAYEAQEKALKGGAA